jgi:hypothetical protein
VQQAFHLLAKREELKACTVYLQLNVLGKTKTNELAFQQRYELEIRG